jgi:hypothetical protein
MQLSSRSTWYYKFVLPICAFGVMCASTFARQVPLAGALACAGGFFFLTWASLRLKNVALHGNLLRVDNYVSVIEVPLSNLVQVTGHPWIKPRSISIRFSPPTKWGETIILIAPIENYAWALNELNTIKERNSGPNQSSDPAFSSGTSRAGHESRHR